MMYKTKDDLLFGLHVTRQGGLTEEITTSAVDKIIHLPTALVMIPFLSPAVY